MSTRTINAFSFKLTYKITLIFSPLHQTTPSIGNFQNCLGKVRNPCLSCQEQENNHGCRRASAFTYLLLIWIGLFKLRLSVSAKNAFVVVKYIMRVRTSTAFTSKVLSFPVFRWEFHFHAYIYLCTCHLLFMLTIYLFVKQLINYCVTLWASGFSIVYTIQCEAQR